MKANPKLQEEEDPQEQQPLFTNPRGKNHRQSIGGPGTILPPMIESFLSWSLAISCLSVSGYYYLLATMINPMWTRLRNAWNHYQFFPLRRRLGYRSSVPIATIDASRQGDIIGRNNDNEHDDEEEEGNGDIFPCWIPLMTCSRNELTRVSPVERYQQLIEFLQILLPRQSSKSEKIYSDHHSIGTVQQQQPPQQDQPCGWTDDELIQTLRSNEICRRLASLAMRPMSTKNKEETKMKHHSKPFLLLKRHQLIRIWPRLLELPVLAPFQLNGSYQTDHVLKDHDDHPFDISIIMPAYHERGIDLQRTLNHALEGSMFPSRIQVIVVDAGLCDNLQSLLLMTTTYDTSHQTTTIGSTLSSKQSSSSSSSFSWGDMKIIPFNGGGGRGPALNFGSKHATGRILTFCHSDTRLPPCWDQQVKQNLATTILSSTSSSSSTTSVLANACAFGFGIDTSPVGLNGGPYPPGLKAVETTANLRTHMYSLPYGDQCLSLTSKVFHYLGGYPDQCLMEDYELIGLLRKRAALLGRRSSYGTHQNRDTNTTTTSRHNDYNDGHYFSSLPREELKIIRGPPALCSPRRWQKYGVLYVTYTNSKCVHRYNANDAAATPEEIYQIYYQCPPPQRTTHLSPWEVELEQQLRLAAATSTSATTIEK